MTFLNLEIETNSRKIYDRPRNAKTQSVVMQMRSIGQF